MSVGFEFRETMSGSYHRLDDPGVEHPMSFTIRADIPALVRFAIDPTAQIQGEVDAEGLADHKPLRGTMEINPFLKRKVVYDFHFPDNAGAECRFHGEKEVEPLRLAESMTTLPGSIFVGEREIARAVLRFAVRQDLLRFLLSFKPT